jgi:hypothetical protein
MGPDDTPSLSSPRRSRPEGGAVLTISGPQVTRRERDTARAMSQENVEIARRLTEAFNRTFTEGTPDLYEVLDPEVEWVPCRRC